VRYINLIDVLDSIPRDEHERLQGLNDGLIPMDIEARKAFINNGNRHWRPIKEYMEVASNRKCWFTESMNPGFPNEVEHFRPKLRKVSDDNVVIHWYWFLAFNPINYRLVAKFPNSLNINPDTGLTGGKHDYFNLLADSEHVDDLNLIGTERPVLLDPCVESDTQLLNFSPDGRPVLAANMQGNEEAGFRVDTSNLRLNLDYPTFNAGREEIYNDIQSWVGRGDAAEGNELALSFVQDHLRELVTPAAQYSSAALCYLRCFRDRQWVEDLIY